jgi:MFS family permease
MGDTPTEGNREFLLTSYSGRLSNLLALGGFLSFLGRGVIPPLLPSIVDGLSISASQAGLVMSVLWFTYAVAHYPGGRLSDILTRKTLIVSSLLLNVVGFAVLTVSVTYAVLLFGVAIVGIGQGLFMPSSRGLVADLFVRRRSQALGIQIGANSAGSALSAALAVAVLSVTTWQASFLPTIAGMVVVAVLVHHWSREQYRVRRVELELAATLRRLLTARRMLLLLGVYSLFSIVWMGVMSFLPTFLQAEKGFSLANSSAAYGLLFVAGIVVSPVAGRLGDRFAKGPLSVATLTVATVGLVVMLLSGSHYVILVGVVLLGGGFFGLPPLFQALLLDLFPDDNLAGDFGALKTIYTAVGAVGPVYIGFVAQRASYGLAFASLVGCLVVAALGFLPLFGWND